MMNQQEITGDTVLLTLGERYIAAREAGHAFEHEAGNWQRSANIYLKGRQEESEERSDVLLEAICMIQAEGIAGAMVQLNALFSFIDAHCDDQITEQRFKHLREHALYSIWHVLGTNVSPAIAAKIGRMGFFEPVRSCFSDDVNSYLSDMKSFFSKYGMDLEPHQRATKTSAEPLTPASSIKAAPNLQAAE